MDGKPTLKELAAMTGFSVSTVSRALSNAEKVKYSTKKRIDSAIDEYYGRKNKTLSGIIGLIVPDLANQFFPLMLTGIDNVASISGYTLILSNSDGNPEKEDKVLKKMIDIGVEGVIFVSSGNATDFTRQIVSSGIVPLVFLDRHPCIDGIDFITTGNYEGMYQAARYLLTLKHRRILYLGGKPGTSTENERLSGFKAAMEEAALPVDERDVLCADFSFQKGYEVVRDLLCGNRFEYTAIAAANDNMALGAIKALQEKRISVPDQVSVIGYDDIPGAEFSGLTTIKQPFVEMGRRATYQLLATIKDPFIPKQTVILPTTVVFRNSCAIASDYTG